MQRPGAPELRALSWTVAAFLAGVLLHIDRVPWWASSAAALCAIWRLAAARRPIRLPGRRVKTVLTLVMAAAVLLMFRTLNGLAAGTALLVAMGSIKLLETGSQRDQYITLGTALFLLLAACLDRQGLLRMPLYLGHVWLCCTALLVISHPRGLLDNRGAALLAGRSLLLALPLAVVLFLFFPRLPGAFWALPKTGQAITGLGDSMSPGSISELTSSDDPAFRVWFEGAPPPAHDRYWRGPVLHAFDGYTWSRSRGVFFRQERREFFGEAYRYRVAMEPHANNWWFSLDTLVRAPHPRTFLTADYQLVSILPVTELTTYEAVSYTRSRALEPLSAVARRIDTALPAGRNPRSRRLAQDMRGRAGSEAQFVREVIELFRTGGFEYTLTPPRLDLDSVDDFLFNTRRGFCGHYASAFVTLMRSAGIPARVVTGYLGGEWNPIGRYLLVRQSDAHAWAEIWLEGQGWTRVDPTAVVAPERLRRGIIDLLPDAVSAQARLIHRTPWLANMGQAWDALNAWWNDRVVSFNFRTQLEMLDRLGVDAPGWEQLGWGFALGLAGWFVWVAWQVGRVPRGGRIDRIALAYRRLCVKLARAGVPREAHVGPLAYAEVIAARRPDLAEAVRPILEQYAELRFGGGSGAAGDTANGKSADVRAFERAVAGLRIARSSPDPS